ncbi:type I-E CRISPR-associated protein Cse1/CasA [Desulfurispira natronophila]|uniref:CRISPR system Cascade subunit CasA n=1 Tax=Desulfurispira natronophila TaxID=682562 RepID=A0A7W8DGI5_9BACT|nr:type I-E CRISPR-associated protein Cse1/CasA [Desulfurispira natronophila]MBB5021288.1 CRISPR system Cascade subunit CasA [Desulfurispira natronophila]
MNVAFDPWIPVINHFGERSLASIHDVFAEGEQYADLAVRPHERVALMRLLLCVAYAALNGPKDLDEWEQVPHKVAAATGAYLKEWQDSFDLFHPEIPWLQVAQLQPIPNGKSNSDDDWTPITRLSFVRASGVTSTLFDQQSNGGVEKPWRDDELALSLLTFQNYFVAGGKASSRLWGETEMKNPPNPKGGPCSGKSILFSFIRQNNLLATIHYNLSTYDDLVFLYGESEVPIGKPLWEVPISGPNDDNALENATRTHLGRFVPQTRILRIHHDRTKVLLGAGFDYPKYQDDKNPFAPDAFATLSINNKNERQLLSARPNRSLWRMLHSVVVKAKNSSQGGRGPLCLLNIQEGLPCDIISCAMLTNPQQAAELVDLIESVFRIPANLFEPEGRQTYQEEVEKAEHKASLLASSIEIYRYEFDGGWKGRVESAGSKSYDLRLKLHSKATTHYWTAIEKNLGYLMEHVQSIGGDHVDETREKWRKMLFYSACDAYRTACGQETPRQIRAFAKGWQKLTGQKASAQTVNQEEEGVSDE